MSHSLISVVGVLTENSSDVVSLVDASGDVLYVSPSSEKVYGYLPEELVGRNTFEMIHPDDRDHSRTTVRELILRSRGLSQVEQRIRHKSGRWCWTEGTMFNLLEEPSVAALAIRCRRINPRRSAREQMLQTLAQQATANAALQDFVRTVAHDLKDPLGTMLMSAEMLYDQLQDPESKELAQFIVESVLRMNALVGGVHTAAMQGFGTLAQPIELQPIITAALQNLCKVIKATHTVVTVGALPAVRGNGHDLLRVFQNLISNAIKYCRESPIKIDVTAERRGPDWIIAVRDNGIGIVLSEHEWVFGLMNKVNGSRMPGDGMGLAICKNIVESLGGRIWVESAPGVGSTFYFTLAATEVASVWDATPKKTEVSSFH